MATQTEHTNATLGTWLWRRPLKFAFITIFAQLGLSLVWGLIAQYIYGANEAPMTPLFVMMGIVSALTVVWLIRKLPSAILDRKSFVALHTAQEIIAFIVSIIMALGLVSVLQSMFFSTYITGRISFGIILMLTLTIIAGVYVLGMYVASLYATFLRMRKMNVATWKLICALPFGYAMLWPAGYITDDARNTKSPVITPRTKWYSHFVNWVMAHPYHALSIATLIVLVGVFTNGILSVQTWSSVIAFIIFGIRFTIVGAARMRGIIPTFISALAIALNVITVVCMLTIGGEKAQTQITPEITNITITETTTQNAQ